MGEVRTGRLKVNPIVWVNAELLLYRHPGVVLDLLAGNVLHVVAGREVEPRAVVYGEDLPRRCPVGQGRALVARCRPENRCSGTSARRGTGRSGSLSTGPRETRRWPRWPRRSRRRRRRFRRGRGSCHVEVALARRRQRSISPMPAATMKNGIRSARYRWEMYPHNRTPPAPAAAPSRMIRVSRTWPRPFGRKAVTAPQQPRRKSRGVVAGKLAVG